MDVRKTILGVVNNMTIQISRKKNVQEYRTKRKLYTCFCFKIKVDYNQKHFSWEILRTHSDFISLQSAISRELSGGTQHIEFLPGDFIKKDLKTQLSLCSDFLSSLVNNLVYVQTSAVLEFLEISVNSFISDRKYKECYANKIGSGRRSNQLKFCNCYNYCHRKHKKWIRVCELGIEYSRSPSVSDVAEVIRFSVDFTVTKGRRHTGFKSGIRIRTGQHNIILRTKNPKERDELEEAIMKAYGNSEYFQRVTRYNSSFLVRPYNTCKWYVDAQGYYEDVYDALRSARSFVYITDWWMSPELYLKRPAENYPDSQVVEVLGQIADSGIRVYVHIYKEITLSLSTDSLHTKEALLRRSPNIQVMRHPNISIKGGVFLWSHHEKMVIVDGEVAFMGGLDLCYGRYDNPEHLLTDVETPYRWNNIDYSNVRVADFTNVEDWRRESIDRFKIPRMPWHDIAMSVRGSVVKDLGLHFKDLWNHAVRDITGVKENKVVIPLHNTSTMQRFASRKEVILSLDDIKIGEKKELFIDPQHLKKQMRDEMNEAGVQDCVMKRANTMKEMLPIFYKLVEGQFNPFLQRAVSDEEERLTKLEEKEEREERELPQFMKVLQEGLKRGIVQAIEERTDQEFSGGSCSCQLLRSGGLWSIGKAETENSIHEAYLYAIANAKHFIYIENQFFISNTAGKPVINKITEALKERIIQAHRQQTLFKVIVVLPLLPGFEGSVDDPNASVLRVQLHYQYKTISRGHDSLLESLSREVPNYKDYIQFYGLRNHDILSGTPVTEMIYVHSKLMIVDDNVVIMGSANINDRSMLGNRDSEIAMIVEDRRKLPSQMAGEECQVSEFAHTLRMSIFKEHSGEESDYVLRDPFTEEFDQVWYERAKNNTRQYRKVFRCYPDNRITSINEITMFQRSAKMSLYDEKFQDVAGHLVLYPLKFLKKENLKLKISNKEYYLPDSTFT